MIFPARLLKRIRLDRGPVLLGQPVADHDAVYAGNGAIHRLDSANLTVSWRKQHEDCRPVMLVDGILIIGDGLVEKALNTDTGDAIWTAESWGGPIWNSTLLRYSCDSVAFVEPSTGRVIGRIEVPTPASFHDLKGDTLLLTIGEDVGIAAAYNLAERRMLWQRKLLDETIEEYDAPGRSLTLVAGTRSMVATKAHVGIFGCSMEDGHILWHHRVFVSHDVPVAVGGRVFVLTQGFPARNEFAKFLCYDEVTGEKVYETEHKEFLAYRPSRPTVYEGHVYFGNDGGFVFALRLADGELVWRHRTTGQTWQPTVIEDRVYVTSDDGHLLAFEGKKPRASRREVR